MSFENDKELIALLDGGINGRIGGYYWYGHVLRVNRQPGSDDPEWVALIVPSDIFVDAPTVDLIFGRLKYALAIRCAYSPPTAQEEEDVFAMRQTFDDACMALTEMIRRFNPKIREEQVIYDPPYPYGLDHFTEEYIYPGPMDMRCMGIYGLNSCKDQNGALPDMPEYFYPDDVKDPLC